MPHGIIGLGLALAATLAVAACGGGGVQPDHGTGAAQQGTTAGFGLGPSNEGSPVNAAAPGPSVPQE